MHNRREKSLKSFLVYKIGSDLFASSADQVRNILDAKTVFKDNVLSINRDKFKIYGRLVTYYDTQKDIGLSRVNNKEDNCLLVVDSNNISKKIGFLVNEVKSLIDVEPDIIKTLPELGKKYNTSCIDKYFVVNGQIIRIINLNNLTTNKSKILTRKHAGKINIIN